MKAKEKTKMVLQIFCSRCIDFCLDENGAPPQNHHAIGVFFGGRLGN